MSLAEAADLLNQIIPHALQAAMQRCSSGKDIGGSLGSADIDKLNPLTFCAQPQEASVPAPHAVLAPCMAGRGCGEEEGWGTWC